MTVSSCGVAGIGRCLADCEEVSKSYEVAPVPPVYKCQKGRKSAHLEDSEVARLPPVRPEAAQELERPGGGRANGDPRPRQFVVGVVDVHPHHKRAQAVVADHLGPLKNHTGCQVSMVGNRFQHQPCMHALLMCHTLQYLLIEPPHGLMILSLYIKKISACLPLFYVKVRKESLIELPCRLTILSHWVKRFRLVQTFPDLHLSAA